MSIASIDNVQSQVTLGITSTTISIQDNDSKKFFITSQSCIITG